ncbi:bifunctional adenosylcobinamide kinase/adenosylcobinamide-phosphate guanylyltransferase [Acinetobacter radioresistens]|jgi:adenosylcobinamide kinase / adenosylcobinamide-phosphate guanylyltransferase|uniref:bifunctional adenosylcobinamide kinase/adenosylcobinamide-phosphate guanylyltransferase n=1 Tax=Acinetobacter TaxID=469 RepID=UPI002003D556|nr:bifunctional adenosylcobinamide kinase/adenosylcobinamide-phosphate guanylyltransferase [Acinetobacter radioresistens]MCK4082050.1 bifunctional adenosylcobinamide kinase/adenosylcobinamide-phosphate guanylyltransferase [Acinetobacter radioresistens]MCK4088315.1 bifunctional adenosylcobinamide kinase/adenosylcobinamide-phosphate guanylyltransferase [Acinetobacter radioresistens]MCK4109406.1 bifunctional adenosylcobinamide kinase/adenosylcobinamide-phosphate guanylyltransferase [Acinetobacter r
MLQLILGGARSGKSRLAEKIALESGLNVIYIATAQPLDEEMQERILHHQESRPREWQVIEEPLYLSEKLQEIDAQNQLILIDCVTLWMSNLLLQDASELQMSQCQKLLTILPNLKSEIILVSNETGLGVVPMGNISRKFIDESGRLHQQIGQIAQKVVFCVAGFPIILKEEK